MKTPRMPPEEKTVTAPAKDARANRLLLAVDLAGTLLFAIEGGEAAVAGHLDLLGLMVLAFATALGGGLIRDLLLNAAPPASLRDWRYPATAFLGGAIVFCLYRYVAVIPPHVLLVLDAAGLAFFAVAGTEKALLYQMNPLVAILMGALTAVGGGTIRDLLLDQVPKVLNADIYATAALFGAIVMILLRRFKIPWPWTGVAGGIACFTLRLLSLWQHWNLPKVIPN